MTVTLKSKKKMSGCVPESRQSGFIRCICSYLTTVHSAILIRSQLEYDRGLFSYITCNGVGNRLFIKMATVSLHCLVFCGR